MPVRPLAGCSYPGCRGRATDGHGRCERHPRPIIVVDNGQSQRPSSSQRGYDNEWRRRRALFLRAHPFCERAGCDKVAEHVDHIMSIVRCRELGMDPNESSNLRSLCHEHHSTKTAMYDGALGNPKRVSIGAQKS